MSPAQLLAELQSMYHDARVQRMVALGRAARTDPRSAALLEELFKGDPYQRRLVLKSCLGSGNGRQVLHGVTDPSRLVRGAARKLVAQVCDDAQAVAALQETYFVRQHIPILIALYQRKRHWPIDTFLCWLAQRTEDTQITDLIPMASAIVLEQLLPLALQRPSFQFWDRMMSMAPQRLSKILYDELAKRSAAPDNAWQLILARTLPALAQHTPLSCCQLVDLMLARGMAVDARVMRLLIARCPNEVLDVGLRHKYAFAAASFSTAAFALDAARLARLVAENRAAIGDPQKLFRKLSTQDKPLLLNAWLSNIKSQPSWGRCLLKELTGELAVHREAAYLAWSHAAQDRDGVIRMEELQRLPADLREREAKRHLQEVTQLKTRPNARTQYAIYLTWEEAKAQLQFYLGHPEGETRAHSLNVLLRIPGLWPERTELVDEALRMALARKNEQDPVRLRMFSALETWPKHIWKRHHLPSFAQLLRDALDAADLSHSTAQAMERVLVNLFRIDGDFGGKWLATLIKERGTLYAPRLGDKLSDEEVAALSAPLLQVAQAWAAREREGHLVALCASLGKRLSLVGGLPKLMEQVIDSTTQASTSAALLTLLIEHLPTQGITIAPSVAKRWVKRDWESLLLGLVNQLKELPSGLPDLIESVLASTKHLYFASGLLAALRYRHAPTFAAILPRLIERDRSYICIESVWQHVHRRRQDLLAPFLGSEVVTGRFATGQTRWVLPFRDHFFRWNVEQHRNFSATLQRITLDPDRDTPTIFWAMERLPKLAFSAADPLIQLTDDKRAFVQEKAVRSLARLDAGQGVPRLVLCLDDARARFAVYALRRALFDMPPTAAVELLRQVPLRKVTVAKEVVRLLGELRSDAAYQLLLSLDSPTLHRDIRIALLRALWDHLERPETWQKLESAANDADWILASRLADIPANRLSVTSEPRLCALLAQVLTRKEPEARIELLRRAPALYLKDLQRIFFAQCLQRINSRFDDEVVAATAAVLARAQEADVAHFGEAVGALRKNRRALQLTVQKLLAVKKTNSRVVDQLCSAAVTALASDEAAQPVYLELAAQHLEAKQLLAELTRLARSGGLQVDALQRVHSALIAQPTEIAEKLELALAQSTEPALRWLAVKVLAEVAGPGQGWTVQRRERLRTYQQDLAPQVASAAQFVFPPLQESNAESGHSADALQQKQH